MTTSDDPRFWTVDVDETNGPANWQAEGTLVGIVDEREGGVVAYCHADSAQRIMAALAREDG
jgi:hypothetical protein